MKLKIQNLETENYQISFIESNTLKANLKNSRNYFLNKNIFNCREASFDHIYNSSQKKVANNESPTDDYSIINASLLFGSKSNKINLLIGVRNLLNVEYIPHLSRLKSYEIPHIGRSYNLKLCLTI